MRRRVPLEELDADRDDDVRRVLDVLADSRLVTIGEGSVEVAHEALLREWPRLRGWLEEDAEGRRLHRHLAIAARDWQATGRDPGELYRGARLAAMLDWVTTHDAELKASERAFVDASRAQSEAEAARARRTNRRLRVLLGSALALLALAGGAGALFFGQRGEARDQARVADARHLGTQALVEADLDRSLLLARQGVELEDSVETRGNLLAALVRSPAAIGVTRVGHGRLNSIAMRPDRRVLVVGDEHGNVSFLDPGSGRETRPRYNARTSYIGQLVFNPSGSRLLVGGYGVLRLLDGRTFRELATLHVPERNPQFIDVAFSPDERKLVAMYEDSAKHTLLRFDGRTGRSVGRPASYVDAAGSADVAAFTPDGRGFIRHSRPKGTEPRRRSHGEPQQRQAGRARSADHAAPPQLPRARLGRRAVPRRPHVRRRSRRRLRALHRHADRYAADGARPACGGDEPRAVHARRPLPRDRERGLDRAHLGRRRGRGRRGLRGPLRARHGTGHRPQRANPVHRGRRRNRDHLGSRRRPAPGPPV